MDTAVLRDVLASDGPFASVYLDGTHDTEDAAKELDLRWRSARKQLVEQDAPERLLAALDEAIRNREPAVGRAGRFLIAAANGTVLVDEYLPAAPPEPVVRLSPLPYLLPLAGSGPYGVPFVVVLVDKSGADLRGVDVDGTVLADFTVDGRDHPVHKSGSGGWSHRNIQKHAEETVRRNIADVAAETAQLVRRVGAHLLVLAGDVEPRSLLRRALPASCDEIAVEVDAARSEGIRVVLERDVDRLVAGQVWAERAEVLERFQAELGRAGGLAVQGLRPTAEALREANVEALVITDIDDETTVWTGATPQQVALEPAELDAMGVVDAGIRARADEVLPAAAIAVGAEVLADTEGMDGDLRLADGVGALLRHG